MPRIDPLQLLRCLGVLLTKDGGIKTKDEVQRLASLMMKFSKKLVSKCVYILILKNTETELLGMFMSAGGWTLILTWLSDGIFGKNWALVTELLQLLLMCPVDVERLKSNSIPRLVKGLSKDENLGQVNVLATKLVEQWLKIVKDETVAPPERESKSTVVIVKQQKDYVVEMTKAEDGTPEHIEEMTLNVVESSDASVTPSASAQVISPQQFYKLTVRDGKQVIAKVDSVSASDVMTEIQDEIRQPELKEERTLSVESSDDAKVKKDTEKRSSSKDRTKHDRSKHKSSSSSRSGSSSSNKDKSSSNSSSSSSRDKHKDKSRDKSRDKDKYKHKSNGSIKHSSSKDSSNKDSSSHNKEKQAEKDKDTLAKIQPKSVEKLGRIPKKSSSDEKEKKDKKTPEHRAKPSISIEVRKKDGGERPKTVKVFNSKLRSTGLEEAPRPPPPRQTAKKSVTLPVLPMKRPSPLRESIPPPEKRIKLPDTSTVEEKPGGIKLIPAKPKRTSCLVCSRRFGV